MSAETFSKTVLLFGLAVKWSIAEKVGMNGMQGLMKLAGEVFFCEIKEL